MLCLSFHQAQEVRLYQHLNHEQKQELKKYEQDLRAIVNGPSIDIKRKHYNVCPKCSSPLISIEVGGTLICGSCKYNFNQATKKVIGRIVFTIIGESGAGIEVTEMNEVELKKRILELTPLYHL